MIRAYIYSGSTRFVEAQIFKAEIMRINKHKSQNQVEYKSSLWKTEIKGDVNNPLVKTIIVTDFILRWVFRPVILLIAVFKIVCQYLP